MTTAPVPTLKVEAVQPIALKKADIPVDPFVKDVLDEINEAASDPNVQITVSRVTKHIPAKVRDILYTVGIVAGAVGTFGTSIVALLTGDAALIVGTGASIALTLQSTLSKLNLSKTAEDVAKAIASGAKVVKAFNTTYAGTLVQGAVAGQPLDVFIAGDDADAKSKVAELVRDGGMRPVDVGPLSRARQIEGMQFLHIVAQGGLGTNWTSTIKILS